MHNVSYANTGEIRVYALFCGGDYMDMALVDPFDENTGTKVFTPYYAYLITHPEGNVLFDTAGHPDLATDPHSRMGAAADTFKIKMAAEEWVVPQLAKLGLQPEDVSTVIQSHLHFDHTGALAWFKHASVLVQVEELEFARNPPVYQSAAFIQADFDADLHWVELNGEHDVFGDGMLKCIPTPGHTRGHQSLWIDLPSRPIFLLADAHYSLAKLRQRRMPGLLWNPDALIETWDKIEEIERKTNACLIVTHELDFETSVPKSPKEYYA